MAGGGGAQVSRYDICHTGPMLEPGLGDPSGMTFVIPAGALRKDLGTVSRYDISHTGEALEQGWGPGTPLARMLVYVNLRWGTIELTSTSIN